MRGNLMRVSSDILTGCFSAAVHERPSAESRQPLFAGGSDFAALREDRTDEARGRDVERGIVRADALGSNARAADREDLVVLAVFDHDGAAVRTRQVDRAPWSGDVE